jgi:pilus assembly protein Flp/PilA
LDMKRRVIKLIGNARGATAIEYGLIVALIVIVIVGGIQALGGGSSSIWANVTKKVGDALPEA